MSADLLRRAASLMRNRANDCALSPWSPQPVDADVSDVRITGLGWESLDPVLVATAHGPAATHIASWHPAVALAVADLLDAAAASGGSWLSDELTAVATAYLEDQA